MSGGSLNYFYSDLEDHVGDLGDKELDDLVSDLAKLFHAREWYLSSDTCRDDWRKARDKFKKKWFTERGHKERIEKYLSEFTSESKETFGIDTHYCKDCKYWRESEKADCQYGHCEFSQGYMLYQSDCCERWEGEG